MNTETTEQKRPIRTAAIFVATIAVVLLIAWLSIKIVNNAPSSFASLASLAESVNKYESNDASLNTVVNNNRDNQNLLIVTSDTNVVSTGEQARLNWTEARTPGSYVFSYQCTDGVSINIDDTDGLRSIGCDTNYNLGNTNTVTLTIDSEKDRYVDVPYTLAFLGTNDTSPQASDEATLTVVNNSINLSFDQTEVTETAAATEVVENTVVAEETTTEEVETSSETNTTTEVTTPSEPTYTQEFTYTIPVSNPNGRIDLATKYITVGRIIGNTFFAQTVDNDFPGAIQFEVKNLGTKTSNSWTYSVVLPSGGTYESTEQEELKPNERALITIGFPESSVTSHDFEVSVSSTGDATNSNNQFEQTVVFID